MPGKKAMRRPSVSSLQKRVDTLKKLKSEQEKRRQLEAELKNLKSPNTSAFKRNVKSGIKKSGKSVWKFLDEITRP